MTWQRRMATYGCGCDRVGCWCHSRVMEPGARCLSCATGRHATQPLPWPAQGPQDPRQGTNRGPRTRWQ